MTIPRAARQPIGNQPDPLEEQVRDTICELMAVDMEEATLDASLREDLGFDSIDQVELAMLLEERFHLPEIADNVVERLVHVRDVVAYVRKHPRALTRAGLGQAAGLSQSERHLRHVSEPPADRGTNRRAIGIKGQ